MRTECRVAAAGYALNMPQQALAGVAGERLGSGAGSSVEFMDFRDYTLGDDLRHVDWRSYARTDQLKVRLFREEIAPILDLVVDQSASMSVTPTKLQATLDLAQAATVWLQQSGGNVRLWAAGGTRIQDLSESQFGGSQGELLPRGQMRMRGLRMLISDFLVPTDPAPMMRRLAAGGAHVYVIQVLDPWELKPSADGARTLIDAEANTRADLILDKRTIEAYCERLTRLRAAVESAVRTVGGTYACVTAAEPAAMFRQDLMRHGMVIPV